MARYLARCPALPKGTPCHPNERRQKGYDKTPAAHGANGTHASQLQESHDSVRPVSHHVRCRAVVERRLYHRHSRVSGGYPAADQPGSPGNNWLLPDNQPGSPLDGVGSQSSNYAAGEQTAALWAMASKPTVERIPISDENRNER